MSLSCVINPSPDWDSHCRTIAQVILCIAYTGWSLCLQVVTMVTTTHGVPSDIAAFRACAPHAVPHVHNQVRLALKSFLLLI